MKVITLWQPWATFIALGWKTIETRTHDRFKNLVGETIGIHAGNTWDKDWEELAGQYLTETQLQEVLAIELMFKHYNSRKGNILCTAFVHEAKWLTEPASYSALISCDPSKIGFERYGLYLNRIKLISTIPAKGKQGIWNYDGEIKYI